jgi:hypothetical protein
MPRGALSRFLLGAALSSVAACGPSVDLSRLVVTETFTGYYDGGIKDGWNHLVPSVSFRLRNDGDVPATLVRLTVTFWKDGDDGEWDGREVVGIDSDPVPPGASSSPILVRAGVGYNLEQPRAELFDHSGFRDVTARILAKRDGKIVPLADVRIDRRILPRVTTSGSRVDLTSLFARDFAID